MESITLFAVIHRKAEQILICFPDKKSLNDVARKLPGIKWSKTYKSWYLPLTEDNYKRIRIAFNLLVTIDASNLREYLIKRAAVKAVDIPEYLPEERNNPENKAIGDSPVPSTPQPSVAYRLSYENLKSLNQVIRHLVLKGYSQSTIRTYRVELMVFFQVLGKHAATDLTTEDVKRWLLKCIKDGLTENTIHSRTNALKFSTSKC